MTEHLYEPIDTEELHYCTVHPDRETNLRCNKCGRYMCVECAVQTPVGYRCRECVRQQDDKFYNIGQTDYITIFAVCFGLSLVAGTIASALRFGILLLVLAFPAGGMIGELALRAVKRRRGRHSMQVAIAGALIGGLLGKIAYVFLAAGIVLFDLRLYTNDLVFLLVVGAVALSAGGMFRMRI